MDAERFPELTGAGMPQSEVNLSLQRTGGCGQNQEAKGM